MRRKFIICGITGWCLEILFTAFDSFRRREWRLTSRTSLWMFPIYGMAAFLGPLYNKIKKLNVFFRGLIYMSSIYLCEYISGRLLSHFRACPWDYSKSTVNIRGIIRLDYAPFWFLVGLLYEKILLKCTSAHSGSTAATVTDHINKTKT
ncbi:MAG: hypothetical protein RR364_04460 [Lachnospiraceae bacterium]